jgi:tryptophanyl-tRNA synthetase
MRIFSGIQPTGRKHLGNYIGAITQWVAGQDRGEAIYCLVDLHAITVPYEPAALRDAVYDTAATLRTGASSSGRATCRSTASCAGCSRA